MNTKIENWVVETLHGIFAACGDRKIAVLGMEMLGCCHGKLGRERFHSLLETALKSAVKDYPARIWVVEIDS